MRHCKAGRCITDQQAKQMAAPSCLVYPSVMHYTIIEEHKKLNNYRTTTDIFQVAEFTRVMMHAMNVTVSVHDRTFALYSSAQCFPNNLLKSTNSQNVVACNIRLTLARIHRRQLIPMPQSKQHSRKLVNGEFCGNPRLSNTYS